MIPASPEMEESAASHSPPPIRPGRRLLVHMTIQIVLVLLYFLPGGLIWNRLDPTILGIPFGVFVTALLLPALIVVNMGFYVAGHWEQDKLVSTEVFRGTAVDEAERIAAEERREAEPLDDLLQENR